MPEKSKAKATAPTAAEAAPTAAKAAPTAAKAAPTATKVAKPKKIEKGKTPIVPKPNVPKPIVAKAPKSNIKEPYNHRVRSLARGIVDAIETPDDQKIARAELKGLLTYTEVRDFALKSIVENAAQWDTFLTDWFAAGVLKEKN